MSFSEHFSLTLIKLVIFSKPSDLPQSYTKGCIVKVDFIYYGGNCQSKPDQLTQTDWGKRSTTARRDEGSKFGDHPS